MVAETDNLEVEVEVVPIGVVLRCAECHNGTLNSNGNNDFNRSDLKFYQHKCDKCGKLSWEKEKYPTIRYKFKR